MSRPMERYRPATYKTLEEMIVAASVAIEPPERLTVSEAAEKYVVIREKNFTGYWSSDRTPYMVKPQDVLASLEYDSMAFVGPARSGKSQGLLNWLGYTAKCDPMDMMVLHMTQSTARNWSLSDLAKLFRNSPELKATLRPGRQQDNVFDKEFLSGNRLTIVHPSITELSGKTVGRLWAMDYDRLPLDIDGEGDPFTLLKKRAQTLKRFGMTVAESSPGHPVLDPKWMPSSPHEAPPCAGILSIYNSGDRHRWYWQCRACREAFEPDFKLLNYPLSCDPMESAEQVVMGCPHCGNVMTPEMQYELNLGGQWLREGEHWNPDGTITGKGRRSKTASFWLKGPAAGFTTWKELVLKYLEAEQDFERSGNEEKLKAVINTDLGLPYTPKSVQNARLPETLKSRAETYNQKGEVPAGVAFLMSMIDVQAGGRPSFVVHTFGIAPIRMENGLWATDIFHVDMWKIRKSKRVGKDGERELIDPASFPEDWDCLIDEVLDKQYPLSDGSGRFMKVKLVGCDSGGAASTTNQKRRNDDEPVVSVTSNAYAFWRRLRDLGSGYQSRFNLLKGAPSRTGSRPDLYRTFPDSQQKSKFAIARGDVPVWLINSNSVKDQASNMLGRTEPGGQVHFPIWHDELGNLIDTDWLYSQLTTEIRDTKGWSNPSKRKNEAFDLIAYCIAFLRHPDIRANVINWDAPASWCDTDWDKNTMVFSVKDGKLKQNYVGKSASEILSKLGEDLA